MIWSIFSKNKEPHVLINELNSEDSKISQEAYHQLLDHPDDECDNLLLITLNSPDTTKEKKLAVISLLSHRYVESAIPYLKKLLNSEDKDMVKGAIDALYEMATPDCIDELVKLLPTEDIELKQLVGNRISRISRSDAMGALLRCTPEDKNSKLYFEIVSIMEELDLFDTLKSNFAQPDTMIKEFYFPSIIKFNRPDFIPLYLDYYPSASIANKDIIIKLLNDYKFSELIDYFSKYISRNGIEGITNLIDIVILSRFKESLLDTIKFIISIKDTKYKVRVLPNLLKYLDPYCYETVFNLLKDNSYELREIAANSLIDLIRKTHNRLFSPYEPNKPTLNNFLKNWEKQILNIMLSRNDLPDDYYKTARKIFFEFCSFKHDLLQPIFSELVHKDFYETYFLLKDWTFEEKFDIFSWLIRTEPSFGSILLSSLNARADETLWRLIIKLSSSFEDEEDSVVFRKNLITRYRNISIERFLKDEDPGVRSAAVKIYAQMKVSGYFEILKNYAKDPSPKVRKAAISSLIEDHTLNAEQTIIEALDDPDQTIVLYVLQELKNKIDNKIIYPYLIRFINSENEQLRNYAKQEIASITKERYKENFNSMTPETRKLAAQAIQKINTNFTDEIINDLRSFDPETRLKAAILLENIQLDKKGQSALLSAMKDPSKKVRAAIVKTLGIVGDKELIKHLISFFNDPDPRVRANTIESIASLGDINVARILLPFVEDSNNRIRANAIVGICRFGKYNVTGILQKMLADKDENMRASALWAIGEIGDALYVPLTYPFMQDKKELIRYNAIKAISRINPQLLAQYLPILRTDTSSKIRNIVKELSYKLI